MNYIFFRVMDEHGEPMTDCGKMSLYQILPGEGPDGMGEDWALLDFRTHHKAFVIVDGVVDHVEVAVKPNGNWMRVDRSKIEGTMLRRGGLVSVQSLKIAVAGGEEVV